MATGATGAMPWKKGLLPAAVFFCTAIGLTYSPQVAEGRKELLLQLPLLVIPLLLLFLAPVMKKYRDSLLLFFSLVCTATAGYLFANAFWTIHHFSLPWSAILTPAFTNHNFSEPVKMHATYLSMQWGLAFIFLMQQGLKTKAVHLRWIYCLTVALLLAGLLQLSSKSVGAALLVVVFTGWPLFLKSGVLRWRALVISFVVVLCLLVFVAARPAFRARYLTDLRADFAKPLPGELAEPRIARWMAGMEIARSSPLLGKGAGTEKILLHEIFFEKKYYNSFLNHLNIHSQYLSLFFKNGIAGLLTYLLVLGLGFRQALKRGDLLYFSFMVLVALVSLGENILDLDKGVWYYSVFFSFFIFFPEYQPPAQPARRKSRNHGEQRPHSTPAAIIAFAGNKN